MKRQLFILAISLNCFAMAVNVADYVEEEPPKEEQIPDALSSFFDMESFLQDFILETKKIEIPGFPDAFNPSIVKWQGFLLMSFRMYKANGSTNPFGLVFLNDEFEPISIPQIFELSFHNPVLPSKQQDPRLITIGNRLFVVYNNILENVITREMRRMFIAELFYDGEKFIASEPECFASFEWNNEARYEKNWVPFEYRGELLLSYSLTPHRVLRPLLGTGSCETVASSSRNIQWDWGPIRGGTQALLDQDQYLAFFHSWKDVPTRQSNGRKISHYVMGAYTFEPHPPFAITAVSQEPIVAQSFYRPPYHKTWKPLRCVFPAGILIDGNSIWVSYGRQDHEMWIAKIDKKKLLKSLIPVSK